VPNSLYNIASTRFALCPNHGCTFCNSPQSFAQILCTANKRNFECSLVDVVYIISRREDFAFVDVVDFDCLQNLCFCKMADSALCHNRNANSILNALDHLRVAHTGNAASGTNVSRNPFQCHNGTSTSCFCNLCLFWCGNVHDDAALEHLSQFSVQFYLCLVFHGEKSPFF
jgi:hypothetical protein